RAYKIQQPDGTVVERIWKANLPYNFPYMVAWDHYCVNNYDLQRVNSYMKTEFTSIKDANGSLVKTAIRDYGYDKNGNVTSETEYDWVEYGSVYRDGNGKPTGDLSNLTAKIKRIATSTYALWTPDASDSSSNYSNSYWLSTSPSLRNAVASSEVNNGAQTLARTEFYYDNPAMTGNLTQQMSWDSTKGAHSIPLNSGNSISVSHQYDGYGNPILSTDARGYQTQLSYGNVGGFFDLYPT